MGREWTDWMDERDALVREGGKCRGAVQSSSVLDQGPISTGTHRTLGRFSTREIVDIAT